MKKRVNINAIYKPSENVVTRDVQGEFILIPITSGIGDSEEDIFSFNETGRKIWNKLDGKKTLKKIGTELAEDFETTIEKIEKDIVGLVGELLNKKMLVRVSA